MEGSQVADVAGPIPAAARAPRREIWSIQYLRAVAAIAVVVFHCTQGAPALDGLRHGVDLFFVISGFIMVALTQDRQVSAGRFLLDRLIRIAPSYWLATLVTFGVTLAGIPLFGASTSPGLLAKSLLFVPSLNEAGLAWPTLYLGWTLNYEMFFYVVFAATLLAIRPARLPLLFAALLVAVLAGRLPGPSNALTVTYTSPLLLEFLAGTALGATFGLDLARRPLRRALAWSLLIVAGFLVIAGRSSVGLYGGMALAAVTAALVGERLGIIPKLPLLRRLGDASFAIYLFQQLAFTLIELPWRFLDAHAGYHVRGHSLLDILSAVLCGMAIYRFVEQPSSRFLKSLATG